MNADEVIEWLGLTPLGFEGGFYQETYRAAGELAPSTLGIGYEGPRSPATAIFYLLTPDTCSLMHVLRGPEIYHFYLGDAVEQLLLYEDGSSEVVHLGADLSRGQRVQHLVPGGVWQGSRLVEGGRFALMGTTMTPGFDLRDFRLGSRSVLLPRWPEHEALLTALTPARVTSGRFELAAGTRDLLHGHLRGPDILAAGLGTGVAADWPPGDVTRADLEHDLARLGEGRRHRGWWTWYVIRRSPRAVVGVAGFRGPPDENGKVETFCDLVGSAEPGAHREVLDALAEHARRQNGVREISETGSFGRLSP